MIPALLNGWKVQVRVIKALMIRELTTRFGRENIGFLWVMAEPLLFALLVGVMWTYLKGPEEHGISIVAFVATGYIPLTFMRHCLTRCTAIFVANGSLMYHRQIKVLDFIFVRVLIEFIGAMMAWLFIAFVLGLFGLFPMPEYPGYLVAGWFLYAVFIFSVCLVIAPLSEMSEFVEKLVPVSTYLAIPISGTFTMVSWMPADLKGYMLMSPMVNGMEMMRYGTFGEDVHPYYDIWNPIWVSLILAVFGLIMCRRVRRDLVVQ